MKSIKIYIDGSSKGNPGKMSIGLVAYNENNKIIKEISKTLGIGTNNEAEYLAVIAALKLAKELNADQAEIKSDSQLLICQLKGIYKVKARNILALFNEVNKLREKFSKLTLTWIPREENKKANYLALGKD